MTGARTPCASWLLLDSWKLQTLLLLLLLLACAQVCP